jgi:hypothetical protein
LPFTSTGRFLPAAELFGSWEGGYLANWNSDHDFAEKFIHDFDAGTAHVEIPCGQHTFLRSHTSLLKNSVADQTRIAWSRTFLPDPEVLLLDWIAHFTKSDPVQNQTRSATTLVMKGYKKLLWPALVQLLKLLN